MTQEWAHDAGVRGMARWRCIECESAGNTAWVTQYGATTYEVEECPECGGEVEYADD